MTLRYSQYAKTMRNIFIDNILLTYYEVDINPPPPYPLEESWKILMKILQRKISLSYVEQGKMGKRQKKANKY